jgi:hypothetical protein
MCFGVYGRWTYPADKLIYIDTDGTISTRAKFLADAKVTKFTSVDIQDFHVTVNGNTAIATMVFKGKGTDSKGKPRDINARWADTRCSSRRFQRADPCLASTGCLARRRS